MLVFVDESGDTGFKIGHGSSAQFTITLVIFPDHAQAEAASHRIDQLRAELRLAPGKGEFHFNDNSNSQRRAFLEAVSRFEFQTFAVIVDKAGLGPEGVSSKSEFYNLVYGLVFESARDVLSEANVTLDSTGDQTFERQLAAYLKQTMNEAGGDRRRIKKVGMKPSHSDNLLQVADMVCGAVARAYHRDGRQTDSFRRVVQHREVSVILWPSGEGSGRKRVGLHPIGKRRTHTSIRGPIWLGEATVRNAGRFCCYYCILQ